jgi:hypothetical protein
MPMPSLFKYFAFVGGALLAMITLASFLLDPATVTTTAATPAKPVIVVQHDPRASKIERWRNEQAALKAAAQTQTADNASLVTKSEQARVVGVVTAPAQAQPVQPVQAPPAQTQATQIQATQAEPALQTADVSAAHDAEVARAAELARAKAEKVKAAKAAKTARQTKLARDRARADQLAHAQSQPGQWQQGPSSFFGGPPQRTASNQQDQFYYGQRAPAREREANAYAPRPSFGPFGGFGRW